MPNNVIYSVYIIIPGVKTNILNTYKGDVRNFFSFLSLYNLRCFRGTLKQFPSAAGKIIMFSEKDGLLARN